MDLCNIRDIRTLLSRHGFSFSKRLGQNFLTAAWVPARIIEAAALDAQTGVLEIGPGIGTLTVSLSETAGKVVSVELDRTLAPILTETLTSCPNTQVIFDDIMKTDINTLVAQHFAGLRPVVVANLPYQITTPILGKLLESELFAEITVMVQKEVAARICAPAGRSDYGAFSVFVAYYAKAEQVFDLPPDCFIPQPKVDSSVIRLCKWDTPPVSADRDALFTIVKAAFAQRRKTLVNCLAAALPHVSKPELTDVLHTLGHDPRVRGETLDLQAFAQLTDVLLAMNMFAKQK